MCDFVFVLSNEHTFALIFIAKVELIKTNRKLFLVPFVSGIRSSFSDNIKKEISETVERREKYYWKKTLL